MTEVRRAGVAQQVLDNPFWHALVERQAHLAEVQGAARRYRPDVTVFHAVDRLDGDGWEALAALAGPGGRVVLARPTVPAPPPGWDPQQIIPALQMTLVAAVADPAWPPRFTVRPLGRQDVPAMVDLAALTRPGPFLAGTVELGGYVGAYDGGRLVAMAGRRASPPGHVEISAVCTHPDARGIGLAAALTLRVAGEILDGGDRPYLHVAADNVPARRVYERLGFAVRRPMEFAVVTTPGQRRT